MIERGNRWVLSPLSVLLLLLRRRCRCHRPNPAMAAKEKFSSPLWSASRRFMAGKGKGRRNIKERDMNERERENVCVYVCMRASNRRSSLLFFSDYLP